MSGKITKFFPTIYLLCVVSALIVLFYFRYSKAAGMSTATPTPMQKLPAVKITFNDSRLQQAVRNALGKPSGDISDTDLAGLTELTAQNDSIADLSGLEYAVNLQQLDLSKNLIDNITPLQNLTGLTSLAFGNNNITDISPLAGLVNLTFLSIKSNRVAGLSALQNLGNLTQLEAQDNLFTTTTGLENLAALTSLSLANCKIENISALQNLWQLTTLTLSGNKITDMSPLHNLTALTALRLLDNKITDITPLQNLTALTELSLSRNKINNFTVLSNLTYLKTLYLTETGLNDLAVLQNLTTLEQLYIANNNINNLAPLHAMTALKTLECYNNNICDVTALQNLSALQRLDIAQNRLGDLAPLARLAAIKNLDISANRIKDISALAGLFALETLYARSNCLDHGDLPALYKLDKLKKLYLNNNPGILSGAAVQILADSLDKTDCDDIYWDGVCGVDPNAAAICWVEPDTAAVNATVTVQATATDTNLADVRMKINWGDAQESAYGALQANASVFTFTHSYSRSGGYKINVRAQNANGAETPWSESVGNIITNTGAAVMEPGVPAHTFSLSPNFPNPFNAATTIRYTLPAPAHVRLCIYNPAGQLVAELLDAVQPAGNHALVWNGTTAAGNPAPSGLYLAHITAGSYTVTRKMILLR